MKRKKTIITTLLAIFLIAATTFTLTACGHAHEYDEKWTTDATNHWHVCADENCKEVSDKAAHTFGEWTVKTPADYGVNRVEKRSCSVCGYEDSKTIEKSSLEYTGTFLMQVRDVFSIPGYGAAMSGVIARGTIKVGDKVKVSGYSNELTIAGIEKNESETASAGYDDGEIAIIFTEKPEKDNFARDAVVSMADEILNTKFTATINPVTASRQSSFKIIFFNGKMTVDGNVKFEGMTEVGVQKTVTIELTTAMPIFEGMKISAIPKANDTLYFTGVIGSIITD